MCMFDYIMFEVCNGVCDEFLGFIGEYGVENNCKLNSGKCIVIVACVLATMTNVDGETVLFDIMFECIE